MMTADTGKSVWGSALRNLAPPSQGSAGRVRAGTAFKPPDGGARRVDVTAMGATAAAAAPVLERTSAGPAGAPQPEAAPEFGYEKGWASKYRVVKELGRGGNGIVTLVLDLQGGQEYATKSIPKVLTDPNISDR